MDEISIQPDEKKGKKVLSKIAELYKRRDECIKAIEKDPKDWTSKHSLGTINDEIRLHREETIRKEMESLNHPF